MSEATIEVSGLDELQNKLEIIAREAPDILYKYTNQAGNKFKRDVIEETSKLVKKKKGHLLKGYRKEVTVSLASGAPSYEAKFRGGAGKARHFHLIENGHRRTDEYFYKVGHKGLCHATEGFTEGFHMVENVTKRWERDGTMLKYAEKAVKEAVKKGGISL